MEPKNGENNMWMNKDEKKRKERSDEDLIYVNGPEASTQPY